jgi:putative phage-type endonuclease
VTTTTLSKQEREINKTRERVAEMSRATYLATLDNGSDEWLELRKRGVGGSEVGTICGLNKWESAYTLWAKKTGRITEQVQMNEPMEWGNRLEPVVIDKFADEHPELEILRNVGTWAHRDRLWQIGNPDALYVKDGKLGVIEVKTASSENDWFDGVPAYYATQVQWYMDVFDVEHAYVIVLFNGRNYREYELTRTPLAQELNREFVEDFRNQVASDFHPDFDGSISTMDTVRTLNPDIVDEGVELGWLGVQYFPAETKFKEAEAELNEVKTRILDAMGSAKIGLVEGHQTFARQRRGSNAPYLVIKRGKK